MSKKVCFFNGFYPFAKGGAEYQARIIAEYVAQGNEVFFISYEGEIKNEIFEEKGIKVIFLKYNQKFNRYLFYLPAVLKIFKILKAEKPDVIYQRVLNTFSMYLSLFARKYEITYGLHIADLYSLKFNRSSFSGLIRSVNFKILNRNRSIKYLVQTGEQEEILRNFEIKNILKVYNAHPINNKITFQDIAATLRESSQNILWIGSARPVKQMEIFIDLAEQLVDFKNSNFHIIGRIDDSDYGVNLMSRIEKIANIYYHGEQNNTFVNQKIFESKVVINSSVSEGFSNVFIQAWLLGVPVVSLNSNPDNLLKRFKLGFCCEGNKMLLKQNLLLFLRDDKLYKEYSRECYLISRSFFEIESNCSALASYLDIVIDRKL